MFMHNLWCYTEKPSQRLWCEYDVRDIDEGLYVSVLTQARQASHRLGHVVGRSIWAAQLMQVGAILFRSTDSCSPQAKNI